MLKNGIEVTSLSAISHLLQHRPDRVQGLWLAGNIQKLNPRLTELMNLAKKHRIPVDFLPPTYKESLAKVIVSSFAYTDLKEFIQRSESVKKGFLLALDHLQDPQNFGALCRTAEGLGGLGVVFPKDRGVVVGSGVYSASVGAIETLPLIQVVNLGDALRKLKDAGYWIVGTSLGEGAVPLSEVPQFDKTVIVLGAELEGLSPSLEKVCDVLAHIPLSGKIQSLNVSAAGAIFMHSLANRPTKS